MKRSAAVILIVLAGALGGTLHVHHATARNRMIVHVTLKDYRVIVTTRHLPVGEPITFVVTNQGHQTHEFVLEPANAFDKAIKFDGKIDEADDIKLGATRTVTWTVPSSGTYKLACHIDHHYQKGMRTLITVGRG